MPGNIAVYVRVEDQASLAARGYDPKPWVRSKVRDAIEDELRNGSVEPNYAARIRKETRLAVLGILRDLVEEGTELTVPAIQGMIDIVNSRDPSETKPDQLLPEDT